MEPKKGERDPHQEGQGHAVDHREPWEVLACISGPMVAAIIRVGPSSIGLLIVIDEVRRVGNGGPGLVGEAKECPAVVV